jgi:MoaA/NifB/PqqE/SkfB family radical SAM enzyme
MTREIKAIDIKLTDACNLNCIMCGQRERKEGIGVKNYINLESLKKFLTDMPDGLDVYLWGGEPLIHPDIREIVDFFISKNAKITINTNGVLLDNHINFLAERNIDALVVSLDGLHDVHDSIRGCKKVFDKIKKSLLKYIEETRNLNKKNVVINFTILKENYLHMEEFCREIKKWDVYSITMNFLILVDEIKGTAFRKEMKEKYDTDITSWYGYSKEYKNCFDYAKLSKICNSIINEHGYFIRWTNEIFVINDENLKLFYEKPAALLPPIAPLCYDQINKKCIKIENAIIIDSNGNVVTCPDFPDTVIGNIASDTYGKFTDKNVYKRYSLDNQYQAICYRCRHRS